MIIHWDQIIGFNWDEGNARKSHDKHNVSMAEAEEIFFNQPLIVTDDLGHSQQEPRFHALGHTDEWRLLHVTFTLRFQGKFIRVISARDMNKKEQAIYEYGE